MKYKLILLALIVPLIITSCSSSSGVSGGSKASESLSEEPVILNPLTGLPGFSKDAVGIRPTAVMVSNIRNAVPQDGLATADICYEAVTEGGITRISALYADYKNMPQIGPTRSVREYYIDFTAPYNAIFVHFGGSTTGYDKINQTGIDDIDGMAYSNISFIFDAALAAQRGGKEHAYFTSGALIQNAIAKKGIDVKAAGGAVKPAFAFSESTVLPKEIAAESLSVTFSSYNTSVFTYDSATRKYNKSEFGQLMEDRVTGKLVAVDNVIVILSNMSSYNGTKLSQYDLSKGTGYYMTKGGAQSIKWSKGAYNNPFVYTDAAGNALKFNTGRTWVCVVPAANAAQVVFTGPKESSSTAE